VAHRSSVGRLGLALAAAVILAIGVILPASAAPQPRDPTANAYVQTNLMSDVPGVARMTDSNLVNPWGMSAGPQTPIWVSDNGTDASTIYRGALAGAPLVAAPLIVAVAHGAPTGQVFNPTTNWTVRSASTSGPALFIFASEAGSITGWNSKVPASSTTSQNGVTVKDAVYKGLAIATGDSGNWLYAANFHAGTVDVFDKTFHLLHWAGAFHDSHLPKGYAPFNIQNLGGKLFVTYAIQDRDKHDDLHGSHHGLVDVYDLQGKFLQRLISSSVLNSPWGLAMAPTGFGAFSGDLLVGNFGDGRINAFDPTSGAFRGTLKNQDGNPIAINGLWGLMFGNGVTGTPQTLFFTAGLVDEAHGLIGMIEMAP
jgi:uncharacterized protein (TIGR03118 family)